MKEYNVITISQLLNMSKKELINVVHYLDLVDTKNEAEKYIKDELILLIVNASPSKIKIK